MRQKYDLNAIKRAADGQWHAILAQLAPELAPALQRAPRHVPCPVHGGKDGFRLFKDYQHTGGGICNTCGSFADGFRLLQWVNGWNFLQTCEAICGVLGLKDEARIPAHNRPHLRDPGLSAEERRENERRRAALKRTWHETLPLDARKVEPARLYLARRGLIWRDIDPRVMRFHPLMPYYQERELKGKFPCIISLVSDKDGKPVTLHRIYITDEGFKAPVESPKKMMPYPSDRDITGGAIRLFPIENELIMGVAEGVETALAVHAANGIPTWSCISTSVLKGFNPPDGLKLVVWGDKDREIKGKRPGEEAATELVDRCMKEGISAIGLIPSQPIPPFHKSIDWLDVKNHYGDEAVPDTRRILEMFSANHQRTKKWKIFNWIM